MADRARLICASDALPEAGKGVRFTLEYAGETAQAFVVRYNGQVFAYLNRCAHVPVELDWQEGEFFNDSGLYFVCSTHGAIYEPKSGYCIGGPCAGKKLIRLAVEERAGEVYLLEGKNNDG